MTAPRPPVTGTARALTLGTLVSAVCFGVGLLLAVLGADGVVGNPLRADEVLASAAALRPWGWSMLGVLAILATPPIGLVVSALELRRLEPRTALLAMAVLGVLGIAAAVALVAG